MVDPPLKPASAQRCGDEGRLEAVAAVAGTEGIEDGGAWRRLRHGELVVFVG